MAWKENTSSLKVIQIDKSSPLDRTERCEGKRKRALGRLEVKDHRICSPKSSDLGGLDRSSSPGIISQTIHGTGIDADQARPPAKPANLARITVNMAVPWMVWVWLRVFFYTVSSMV